MTPQTLHIISYPKSGRTWLCCILAYVAALSRGEDITKMTGQQVTNIKNIFPEYEILVHHDRDPHKMPHWDLRLIADKNIYENSKILLLLRDPRDIVVSLWFHIQNRRYYKYIPAKSLKELVYCPLGGIQNVCKWRKQWLDEFRKGTSLDIFCMQYELMINNAGIETEDLFEWLKLDPSWVDIDKAVAEASFKKMQAKEKALQFADAKELRPYNRKNYNAFKCREGKVGSYKKYMKEREINYCNRIMKEVLGE